MISTLLTLIAIIITSIAVLLCFFSCYVASKSDEQWEEIKRKMVKKDDERH